MLTVPQYMPLYHPTVIKSSHFLSPRGHLLVGVPNKMAGHVLIVLRSGTITGKNYIAQFVIREYAKNYKTPLKYSRDLASYRRQVASLRRKFREECEEEVIPRVFLCV